MDRGMGKTFDGKLGSVIRRAAELSFSPLAALRSSDAVRSSRVIDTAAPIDAAPLKSQHRVRV
jgi:hypothetical protein